MRHQGRLKILSFPQGQHYIWCLATCLRIVSLLWELKMLPLAENSKQEKYWKHQVVSAYKQLFFSFLTHKNLKLDNIVNLSSESEHAQRSWLQSIFTTDQYSIHCSTNLFFNVACSLSKNYPKSKIVCFELYRQRMNTY